MRLLLALLLVVLPPLAAADDQHVTVSLLSEYAGLVPGKTAWL